MADDLAGARAAVGLRILDVPRQRVDDVAGEMGAIGGRQGSPLLALEVVLQDQFVIVLGKDQVKAGPLEISVEKQLDVRDDNGVRRGMPGRRRKGLDVDVGMGKRAWDVSRQLGVKFASKIQRATKKRLILK